MKKIILTSLFFGTALGYWIISGSQQLNRDKYLTQNILDISRPVDVSIDIDFLKSLVPAYE
jgi:hypothetical protein